MGIKQLYNDNLWKLPNEYGDVSVMGLRVIRPGTKSSQTVQGQNLHKLSGDKIKCLIIGHSMKFNFKFQLAFFGSCNLLLN